MAWFPWAALPARSNMTTGEVVDWLRYRAIDFGAPTVFIDALDDLVLAETAQEEIDELREELDAAKGLLDDVREALKEKLSLSEIVEIVENLVKELP